MDIYIIKKLSDPQLNPQSCSAQNASKAGFKYWTAQDTIGNRLMNMSLSDSTTNSNHIEHYKSFDDGSVLDPITGSKLTPADQGYEQTALSPSNCLDAFSIKQRRNGTIKYSIEDGFKISPFLETTFADGSIDNIIVYDEVHTKDRHHTENSMVMIEDSGVIRFEDVVGGNYDYNDAVIDPSQDPKLEKLLTSSIFN